jgi:hypothetical protein
MRRDKRRRARVVRRTSNDEVWTGFGHVSGEQGNGRRGTNSGASPRMANGVDELRRGTTASGAAAREQGFLTGCCAGSGAVALTLSRFRRGGSACSKEQDANVRSEGELGEGGRKLGV